MPRSTPRLTGCCRTKVSLDELLQRADVVSLHPKLTSETEGLIGKRETFLVLGEDGAWHQADLYRVATPTGPYSPAPNYLDLMIEGAQEHDLDAGYTARLIQLRRDLG